MSAKIIQFPTTYRGVRVDNSAVRVSALEKRLGIIEQRLANYGEDMDYLQACMEEDAHELSEVLNELAYISGFDQDN